MKWVKLKGRQETRHIFSCQTHGLKPLTKPSGDFWASLSLQAEFRVILTQSKSWLLKTWMPVKQKAFLRAKAALHFTFPSKLAARFHLRHTRVSGVAWATAEDKMWTGPSQWNGSRSPPNLFVIRSLIVCTYTHHTSATALLHIFSMSGTAGRTSFAVAAPVQRAAAKTVAYLSP